MGIEEFIKNNREEFDFKEPSSDHFTNFEKKLGRIKESRIRFNYKHILRIASIVVLILMSSLWIIQNFILPDNNSKSLMQLSDISRSYQEVEMFYTSGINTALNQFEDFGDEGEKLKTDVIEHEFADLDSTYIKLQEELSLQPGDERIIDAMIIHYRTKLEIVNRIISQLENVKSLKPNKHETKEI